MDMFHDYEVPVQVAFTTQSGAPASVDPASIVWASSDETVIKFTADSGGDPTKGTIGGVAPGAPARVSVSADADLGNGVETITGVTEDFNITTNPASRASIVTLTLGTPAPKPVPVP